MKYVYTARMFTLSFGVGMAPACVVRRIPANADGQLLSARRASARTVASRPPCTRTRDVLSRLPRTAHAPANEPPRNATVTRQFRRLAIFFHFPFHWHTVLARDSVVSALLWQLCAKFFRALRCFHVRRCAW